MQEVNKAAGPSTAVVPPRKLAKKAKKAKVAKKAKKLSAAQWLLDKEEELEGRERLLSTSIDKHKSDVQAQESFDLAQAKGQAEKLREETEARTKLAKDTHAEKKQLTEALEAKTHELGAAQTQISNAIKAQTMEHYGRLRERNPDLPHWTVLKEKAQIEWQKLILSLEALKAKRQELLAQAYSSHNKALGGGNNRSSAYSTYQ